MMGREVWAVEPVGVGGRIGRVCLGRKGEQKGGRDLRTSLRRKRERIT